MKFKIHFLLLAFSLLLSNCASTQNNTGTSTNTDPELAADKLTADMAAQLKLTDEQTAKVKAINLKYFEKLQIIHNQPRSRSKMKVFKNMSKDINVEMKTILTPQQYVDYEKILEERKDKIKQRRG